MWSLYKDPKGVNVFEEKTLRSDSFRQSQLHRQDSERIESLEKEVGTLKQRLNSVCCVNSICHINNKLFINQ